MPRLGALRYELGCPTPEASQRLFDEMDFQRAVQAYLWAYPAVSFESIRVTAERDLDMDLNDLGIADGFVDSRSLWLTANDTTIYAFVNIDVARRSGRDRDPARGDRRTVGRFLGALAGRCRPPGTGRPERWQLPPRCRRITTVNVPSSGYHVLEATMHNHNLLVRGIIVDNDVDDAVARIRKVRVFPWSERDNPTPNKFVSITGKDIDTTPPGGIEFWNRLSTVVNNNPVQEHDRFFMAMLKPLGIEKGKPFSPDARQTAILEEAALLGDAMARNVMFELSQRSTDPKPFPGTQWDWVILVAPSQETEYYSQLDERLRYTYGAIYTSPAIGVMRAGPGTNYVQAFNDKNGNHFDGGQSYHLHVPANPPAAAFWSLTLYDNATRSMVQNSSHDAARSSYDDLETNDDGSIDLYFGPTATGDDRNWIETTPGRGFYPMFRFYSPTEPLFDGTWTLPDVERR